MPLSISNQFYNPLSSWFSTPPKFDLSLLQGKSPEELNLVWKNHLETVKEYLKEAPSAARKELLPIFENLSFDHLTSFFNDLVHNDAAIPEVLYDCIPLHKMDQDVDAWAKRVSHLLSNEIESADVPVEMVQRRNVITQFFPNLARILMRSFTIFDSERPPDSLYEYGVIITMYFNFFQIPYTLFVALNSMIPNPWIVLAAGTLILAMAVGMLYSYQRWFKGCPKTMIHCEDPKKFDAQKNKHVLGRENEYLEVESALKMGRPVMIHGIPGVGKSEFMHGLQARFPDYTFFTFKNEEIVRNGSYGTPTAANKLIEAFQEGNGYKQIVYCLDEFGDAYDSCKSDFDAILKKKLDRDYQGVRFIAATTTAQWKKLTEPVPTDDPSKDLAARETGQALKQRFYELELQPASQELTEAILFQYTRFLGKKVPVSKKVIEHIVKLAKGDADHAQPRYGKDKLTELIGEIETFDPDTYTTEALRKAQDALDGIRSRATSSSNPEKYEADIAKTEQIIHNEMRDRVQPQRDLAKKIQKLYQLKIESLLERNKLIRKIASGAPVTDHDKVKALSLHKIVLRQIKDVIRVLKKDLNPDINLKVNIRLVESRLGKPVA